MKRSARGFRNLPWITALVVVAVGGGAAAISMSPGYEWSDPQPPTTSEEVLTEPVTHSALGLELSPPPADVAPVISAEEAVAAAWNEEGAPGDPKEIHATYALLTWGSDYKDAPVWVVTYLGADCIPPVGAPGDPYECLDQKFQTLMDATTGEYIASVTSPELGSAGL